VRTIRLSALSMLGGASASGQLPTTVAILVACLLSLTIIATLAPNREPITRWLTMLTGRLPPQTRRLSHDEETVCEPRRVS
jgi:hypothetical protein